MLTNDNFFKGVAGTAAQIADQLSAYAEIGVSEFIVPDFTLGDGSRRADSGRSGVSSQPEAAPRRPGDAL